MDGVEKLIDSMKRVVKSELGSYDTTATVRRVEGDTAWVHIPGGVDETPVRLTMNAKEGDSVQVRVSDGKAFLAGNVSAPPTDDTTAEAAKALANRAAEDAGRAKSAADIAESYATSAQASAAQSANILEGMEQAATAAGTTLDGIYADAAEAKATTDEINTYADTAGKTVTQILEDGETAGVAAQAASEAANSALVGLSTVEDVVGVLNWITEHGTMTLTSDVTVNPAHVYFVVDPTGDYVVGGTHYSIVSEPDDADISTYYELSIDESVQNYVATHIVVDSEGLWIIPDAGGNKVLIATGSGSTYTTAGTYIVGKVGGVDTVLAEFTASGAVIGDAAGAHTSIDEDGMQIYSVDSLDNVVNLANIGYGEGATGSGSTGTAPFYTFGKRKQASHAYDSTQTYDVGDLVLYGNPQKEYCCKVAIETPEAWTSSHWKLSIGNYSIASGNSAIASGYASRAEGHSVTAVGEASHAEGRLSISIGDSSHAEGNNTEAIGDYGAHAEGFDTTANGNASHAEGQFTHANGANSHAEGLQTNAGWSAHAEGYLTTATSEAHSEGRMTTASGRYSHAQNFGTISSKYAQTALGTYNKEDTSSTTTHPSDDEVFGQYAVIVGNGEDDNARSNALTVDWSGNVEAAGDIMAGGMAGMIQMFAGSTAPAGWLICDGSAVSRTDYATLFAVIGTTYGTGDGSTTFNLPDMRGRVAVGVGNGTATGHTNHTLGQKNGNEDAIVPYHDHTMAHTHNTSTSGEYYITSGRTVANASFTVSTSGTNRWTVGYDASGVFHTRSATSGSSAANTGYAGTSGNVTGANMQPYLAINYIIATGKTA